MQLKDLFNGEEITCPKCEGLTRLRGQQVSKYNQRRQLPNYKEIEDGICFLCNGTGKSFLTDDNRLLKFVTTKNGNQCLLEYHPETFSKVRIIPDHEYKNKKPILKFNGSHIHSLDSIYMPESLFPNKHELLWGVWSKAADKALKENPNSKPISMYPYYDEEANEPVIEFTLYLNADGKYIQPFYEEAEGEDLTYNAVAQLNNSYIGASGTYFINSDKLMIAFKLNNILGAKEIYKQYDLIGFDISTSFYNSTIYTYRDSTQRNISLDNIANWSGEVMSQIFSRFVDFILPEPTF